MVPGDRLKDFVWRNKVFHPHFHDDMVALGELLAEGVAEVDPQPISSLVLVAQAKVLLLHQPKAPANLRNWQTSINSDHLKKCLLWVGTDICLPLCLRCVEYVSARKQCLLAVKIMYT